MAVKRKPVEAQTPAPRRIQVLPETNIPSASQLLQKKETKIGLVILGVLILGLGILTAQAMNKAVHSLVLRSTKNDLTLTQLKGSETAPIIPVASASPSATPIAQHTVAENNQKLQAIKKLSFTNAAITVRVKEGDNFWRIAKRVCGNGKLAEYLRRQTGHMHKALQPGDVLRIKCRLV